MLLHGHHSCAVGIFKITCHTFLESTFKYLVHDLQPNICTYKQVAQVSCVSMVGHGCHGTQEFQYAAMHFIVSISAVGDFGAWAPTTKNF
jgi:hypothetical protein